MLGDNNNKENNTNNVQPVDSPLLDESFAIALSVTGWGVR